MSRSTVLAFSVAVLLTSWAASAASTIPCVPVGSGDRVSADIDAPSDRDEFAIEVAAGARIAVTVTAAGKSTLLPTMELQRPDGSTVNLGPFLQGEGTRSAVLPGLRFDESGTYRVIVRGFGSTTGAYLATVNLLIDTGFHETVVVPAGGTVVRSFPAWDDVSVSFSATEKGGPGLAGASIENPAGATVQGSDAERRGAKLSSNRVLLADGRGLYGIVLEGAAGGDTTVDFKAAIKFPRAPKRKIRLGAEPRPISLSPVTGRDGETITIEGTGFMPGSRVLFDGTEDAIDVRLTPAGTLTCACPAYSGSAVGANAVLTVLNPDGQSGTADQRFRFIGVPGPQWVEPAISPTAGGAVATVHGVRFRAGAAIRFGGVDATGFTLLSGTAATCVVPAHASGTVDITMADEFGRPGVASVKFDYIDPPVVTSASPTQVPSFGGQTITLTGAEFVVGDRVFVGGVEATNVVVASRTSLSFKAGGGTAGPLTIEVRDPFGRSGFKAAGLTMTESFQDFTSTAVPAAASGTDFPGQSLALADLSGDGRPDIVVAASVPHLNSLTKQKDAGSAFLLNNGNGTFSDATSTRFSVAQSGTDRGQADALLLGDFDANGTAEILLSKGTPLLSSSASFTFQGYTGYYYGAVPPAKDTPSLVATRLFTAGGGGVFSEATTTRIATATSTPCFGTGERWQASASALGDLDGDGDLDLLVAAGGRVDNGAVSSTKWTYRKVPAYYGGYYYYRDAAFLTQTVAQVGSARILRNGGGGKMTTIAARPAPLMATNGTTVLDAFSADSVACGDLDGDGIADAVLLSKTPPKKETTPGTFASTSALRVLFSNNVAKLTFDATALPAVYETTHAGSGDFWQGNRVLLGDLDGDSKLDIVVVRDQIGTWTDAGNIKHLLPAVRIFRNLGSRKFSEDTGNFLADDLYRTGGTATLLGVRAIALADVDRDGKKDLVVTSRQTFIPDAGNGLSPDGLLPAGTRSATRILLRNASGKFVDDTTARISPVQMGSLF